MKKYFVIAEIVRRLQQLNVQLSPAHGFNTIGNAVKSK